MASLDAAEAVEMLDELRGRVAAIPGAKLAVAWRLTRPKRGGDA
jgi:hypothetical protein